MKIGRRNLSWTDEIQSSKADLKKFGLTLGIVFGLLGAYFLWRGKSHAPYFLGASTFFLFFGAYFPAFLKPVQKAWMTLALLMGWVMTRVILAIVFYLVITPIGFMIRLSGKDFMNRSFPRREDSYWLDHAKRVKEDYERQF